MNTIFVDKEAELRYMCLLIAKDLTDNINCTIDGAKLLVAFVDGTLADDTEDNFRQDLYEFASFGNNREPEEKVL